MSDFKMFKCLKKIWFNLSFHQLKRTFSSTEDRWHISQSKIDKINTLMANRNYVLTNYWLICTI